MPSFFVFNTVIVRIFLSILSSSCKLHKGFSFLRSIHTFKLNTGDYKSGHQIRIHYPVSVFSLDPILKVKFYSQMKNFLKIFEFHLWTKQRKLHKKCIFIRKFFTSLLNRILTKSIDIIICEKEKRKCYEFQMVAYSGPEQSSKLQNTKISKISVHDEEISYFSIPDATSLFNTKRIFLQIINFGYH